MIAMKIGWLLLVLLFVVYILFFGSSTALAMVVLLILVPLFSFMLNMYLCRRLQISVSSEASLRKADSGSIIIKIHNPTILPVLCIRCKVLTVNQLNGEETKSWVTTWAGPKRMQKVRMRAGSTYCGRIRISVVQAVLYDCFGLLGVRCKSNAVAHMVVQPDTFETQIILRNNPNVTDESDVYSQERPGADITEPFQIREYVPGDSIRQIHWKLSNKFDKLIVRDASLPITRDVLVFWERTGESKKPELIDAQAETIVSLCRSLIDMGIQFSVGWNDTDRNLCILHEIQNMDEFVGVIPRLLRATGIQDGISGAQLLLQTHPEALCGHIVYIAEEPQSEVMEMKRYGQVTSLVCGKTWTDDAVMFDAVHYREQLKEFEI